MRISAIIPVYNCERYVADAIESVFAQTRPVDELIVVDDGSVDGTPEVLRTFEGRIRLLRQANAGTAAALNAGLSVAGGDIFTFLDADDLWTPGKTRLQADVLAADASIEVVFGAIQQFRSPDVHRQLQGDRLFGPPQPGIVKIAAMLRRSAFERVGAFDASTLVDFVDWYTRAAAVGLRSHMLDATVALRRIHDQNIGLRARTVQYQDSLAALKNLLDRRRREQS
jgi:glycosyltransferase involved in cell wall biosynthesis